MTGEIDSDFYCLFTSAEHTMCEDDRDAKHTGCVFRRRKWPTPEQFRKEYGREWKGAVYAICTDKCASRSPCYAGWTAYQGKGDAGEHLCNLHVCVCACTPWGKPADDWRPS